MYSNGDIFKNYVRFEKILSDWIVQRYENISTVKATSISKQSFYDYLQISGWLEKPFSGKNDEKP